MAKQQQAPAERRAPKVKRVRYDDAANRVIAEAGDRSTLSELAKKADAIVVASGGQSNLRTATHRVRRALETAESLGVVKLTRPTDLFVSKVR